MLIANATIVNEGHSFVGSVLINGEQITQVREGRMTPAELGAASDCLNAEGMLLLPGVIDTHVHFREPGLTHKADICSESRAAVAGGVTSFMDMPNTLPQTTTVAAWQEKCQIASRTSAANYSFYVGATNDNLDELRRLDAQQVCGIKLFLGSSTGNMLVNNSSVLERIFAETTLPIAAHCEDEQIIQNNKVAFAARYGEAIPFDAHPLIRSREACLRSTAYAVELAMKHKTRLHVLHVSTRDELALFSEGDVENKTITAETCPHYLWFCADDYERLGSRIKCNPAIKENTDRQALHHAIAAGKIDTIGTDHAPHLLTEKEGNYAKALSGFPSIQFSLPILLELAAQGLFSQETVVEKMCHAPAKLFGIAKRGFIRVGYQADLALVKPQPWMVTKASVRSKCGWSPYEGVSFGHSVARTWVNGQVVYADGQVAENIYGQQLTFNR